MCGQDECNCWKTVCFTLKQFQMEGSSFENTIKKSFRGSQTVGNNSLKPTVNTLAPVISMAVGAKTKKPQVAQATTNILKSMTEGKILCLTDRHGNALRMKVRGFYFK